mmetsp:Transcript_28094/g.44203  ORF Transcript_28094/g.44203 Transcript_28094/m.44203 type:complete len:121 (+) Transcript_28094:162-524(+)|eukprot:CAMPEP_0201730348 /NCGR_PEP_ID=MMETSP0593-20130828/21841_1 /ASSEMBLY_ACC=CAM_ASM_000672 /TAXON_ID=267983 /ORGANISM="Skeletonema japonicum, Strain CCMP2506" /LENGTH=120 /DNA_ID=CAMNT_0048222867 /DNA_START=60 /DNA_END=422 /DNA_ORIENTATION=-
MTDVIDPAWKNLVECKHLLLTEAIKDLERRRENSLSAQQEELSVIPNLKDDVAKLQDEVAKLQDVIASLKLDKIALEEKIASDERVSSLEKERDYYRKESMRLNTAVESMKCKPDKKLRG